MVREQETMREIEFKRWLASEIVADGPDIFEALGTGLSYSRPNSRLRVRLRGKQRRLP